MNALGGGRNGFVVVVVTPSQPWRLYQGEGGVTMSSVLSGSILQATLTPSQMQIYTQQKNKTKKLQAFQTTLLCRRSRYEWLTMKLWKRKKKEKEKKTLKAMSFKFWVTPSAWLRNIFTILLCVCVCVSHVITLEKKSNTHTHTHTDARKWKKSKRFSRCLVG